MSDLRGFTSLAGRLAPEAVIGILNRYLARVVEILTRYRATVDEFQGDGILAFFGAPLAAPDDAERAVACAVEMQHALVALNAEQQALGLPALAMGIGINTGEVIDVRGTLALALKGVDAPITIYDVAAIRGAYATALPDRGVAARLRALSATTAEASVDGELAERESVKLVVNGMDAYVKVVERREGGDVVVAFTDVSPDLKRWREDKLATR